MLPALPPAPPRTLLQIAAAIGASGDLIEAARLVAKRKDNICGLLLRDLSREEIAVMEDRGCRSDDWTRIKVAQDFDCFRVRRANLKGDCVLGRFGGTVEVIPGFRQDTGIYDCTLINVQVANDALVENVRCAANTVIDREAVLFGVGSITCSGAATFGCGRDLPIANEAGGREVPLWAEITVEDTAVIARDRHDVEGQAAVKQAVVRYVKAITSPVCWIRRGARVVHTERLHDAYIGQAAVIDHAHQVANVAVLSSAEEPVRIENGAEVESAVIQWGVHVSGGAIIRTSALLEHSAADLHATVIDSVIGPNTHVAKGEVTASLVGPFVGFHHQSLLIAAFWPEGKGNIAYGAMVGSNHTGRAPDQEVWPGEGVFFGLGCSVRLPADFSEAPYSVVSMGVSTLPQKVTFPFSLITVPVTPLDETATEVPRAYNEILPAWALAENAYAIVRHELKYAKRDRARRHHIDYKVLRPHIMRLVKVARDHLAAVPVRKDAYLETDIPGLGKNFLREERRVEAIRSYDRALTRYALRLLLNEAEGGLTIPGSAEIAHELADQLFPGVAFSERMQRLIEAETENAQLVQDSKSRDDARGTKIIPGYAAAHVSSTADEVVASAWARVRKTEERIRKVLG